MKKAGTAVLIVFTLVATLVAPHVFSATSLGYFEIDGNLNDDSGVGDPLDWSSPPPGVVTFSDPPTGTDDVFTADSKELNPGNWGCITGKTPAKDDIVNGAVAFRNVEGHQFVYFRFERASGSGDAHIDLELNRSNEPNPACPGLASRGTGDLVITFDSAQGGSKIFMRLFRWEGDSNIGSLVEISAGKRGETWDGALNLAGKNSGTFGEASIDLTAAIGSSACTQFSTAHLKSRAVQSISSDLRDFTASAPISNAGESLASGSATGARFVAGSNDETVGHSQSEQSGPGISQDDDLAVSIKDPIPSFASRRLDFRGDLIETSSRTYIGSEWSVEIRGSWSLVDDPENRLNSQISPGVEFVATYKFGPTLDSNEDPTVGDYEYRQAPFGIRVESAGLVFETDPQNVDFLIEAVNRDQDAFVMHSYENLPLSSADTVDHISWQLDDPSGTAISSDSLPVVLDLTKWESDFGLTIDGNEHLDERYFLRGHVESVSPITTNPSFIGPSLSRSVSQLSNISLLDGIITADLVRSVAEANATGKSAAFNSDGSFIANLAYKGISHPVTSKNTRIELPASVFGEDSYLILFEEVGSTLDPPDAQTSGGSYESELTVNMIRLHVTDADPLTVGEQPVDITLGSSYARAVSPRTTCE